MVEPDYEQRQTDHTDPATSHSDPVGLLSPSDVQALRAAGTVTFHTTDGGSFIDACLSSAAFAQPHIYTTRQQQLFPDGTASIGAGASRWPPTSPASTTRAAGTNTTCPAPPR